MAGRDDTAAAAEILASERIPHHALPSHWWSKGDAFKLAVMALGALLLVLQTTGALRWVVLAGTAYVAVGILVVTKTGSERLGLLFPWRASVFLYPISLFALLSAVVVRGGMFLIRVNPKLWRLLLVLLVAILVVSLVLSALLSIRPQAHAGERYMQELFNQVHSQTSPEDIILIPQDLSRFRLEAQRPIYVDWKSHPYLPSEFLQWWARIRFVEDFYEASIQERQAMCRQVDVDYYVVEFDSVSAVEEAVLVAEGYALVQCR